MPASTNLTSYAFMIPAADYIRGRALKRLRRYGILVGTLVLATLLVACYDVRFVFVALIELLIVFPMILCMVWMTESFSVDALRETAWHTVTLNNDGVLVTYCKNPADSSEESGHISRHPQFYSWSEFMAFSDRGDTVDLLWVEHRRQPLRLPDIAFDNDGWQTAASILARYLKSV